jgi:hypothetical protein
MGEFAAAILKAFGFSDQNGPNALAGIVLLVAGGIIVVVYKSFQDYLKAAFDRITKQNRLALCVYLAWAVGSSVLFQLTSFYIAAAVSGLVLLAHFILSLRGSPWLKKPVSRRWATTGTIALSLAAVLFAVSAVSEWGYRRYRFQVLKTESIVSLLLPPSSYDSDRGTDEAENAADIFFEALSADLHRPLGAVQSVDFAPKDLNDKLFSRLRAAARDTRLYELAKQVTGYSKESLQPIRFVLNSKIFAPLGTPGNLSIFPRELDLDTSAFKSSEAVIQIDGTILAGTVAEKQRVSLVTTYKVLAFLTDATKDDAKAQKDFAEIWSEFGRQTVDFVDEFAQNATASNVDPRLKATIEQLKRAADENRKCAARDCVEKILEPLFWSNNDPVDSGKFDTAVKAAFQAAQRFAPK